MRILGKRVQPKRAAARPGDIRHSRSSTDRIGEDSGWRAEIPMEEGLRKIMDPGA